MKMLSAEQTTANLERFKSLVKEHFSTDEERIFKLNKLIDHFEDRLLLAPASSKEHYHGSHPGGYLEHCLNVYDIAMDMAKTWSKYSKAIDYTLDEVAFIALFHDLGKLGDLEEEFYKPQDNDWRKMNMGEIYKINPKVVNMNGADRSLFTIQHFGIQLTQNEWITIRIHEGLYDEGNETYLKTMFKDNILKSHLPHLIHHSDMMASRIEYEEWKNSSDEKSEPVKTSKYQPKKTLADTLSTSDKDGKDLFAGLFK